MSDLRDSFFQECDDLMEVLNDGLTALDEGDCDPETINAMFRSVHSIKGGAGAFGLDALVGFSHAMENLLDDVRSGAVTPNAQVTSLLFVASDHLSDLIDHDREGTTADMSRAEAILNDLRNLSTAPAPAAPGELSAEEQEAAAAFQPLVLDLGLDLGPDIGADPGADPDPALTPAPTPGPHPGLDADLPDLGPFRDDGAARPMVITFSASEDLYRTGNDPALLFRALKALGDLTVTADDSQLPPLAELDAATSYLTWRLQLDPAEGVTPDTVEGVFEFVDGICTYDISDAPPVICEPPAAASPDAQPPAAAQPAPDTPAAPPPAADGPASSGASSSRSSASSRSTIRVELHKVDRLINLVGELVIGEAMLRQSMSEQGLTSHGEVDVAMGQLRQLSGFLQESVMTIRAQPVRGLFHRISRIAREAGREAGKSLKLVTVGEATELDKTVTERLTEPLTHMVRNAVDHGLERPENRIEAGKPERGTITLSAAHRSGRVLITLSDDGGGIDRARVRRVAEEKGLISPDDDLSDSDIDNLLFLPGFSTNAEVSKLSGRGVGMDVVRSEINALGGRVSLQSQPGEGTTVTISLPLTLAVLEGMIVTVAGETMVVPTSALRETFRTDEAAIHDFGADARVLAVHDGYVPIVDLGAALGFREEPDTITRQSLLLIENETGERTALIVDAIQGQHEVVIKGLEQNYHQVPGIAAATILGDGNIALIVDTDQLMSSQPPVTRAVADKPAEVPFRSAQACPAQ
ncbi:chemotaxis protein CheA [Seohaeicola saemankumensis]|nr:chemotaxis protein CheA [Seohaeicola saemankumensis]MCA0872273.1 chemotaxis protein CheA [Seohaeicola saemankumensis]